MSKNVKILELPKSMCNLYNFRFGFVTNWEEWVGMGGTGEEEEENDNGIVTNPIIIKIMPRLQSLTILNCDKLKSLPDYLLTAPLLKKLEIYRSKLLQKHYQIGNRKNWHKISDISNIELAGCMCKETVNPSLI